MTDSGPAAAVRSTRDWAVLYAKGLAMGMADLVPGVSGGTIAFITGIYDELVDTIAGVKLSLLDVLRRQGIAQAWKTANLSFMVVLLAGILTSVVAFAGLLHWLLENRPVQLWAFFFGLVAASVPIVGQHVDGRGARVWLWGVLGAVIAGVVTSLPPLVQSDALFFLTL